MSFQNIQNAIDSISISITSIRKAFLIEQYKQWFLVSDEELFKKIKQKYINVLDFKEFSSKAILERIDTRRYGSNEPTLYTWISISLPDANFESSKFDPYPGHLEKEMKVLYYKIAYDYYLHEFKIASFYEILTHDERKNILELKSKMDLSLPEQAMFAQASYLSLKPTIKDYIKENLYQWMQNFFGSEFSLITIDENRADFKAIKTTLDQLLSSKFFPSLTEISVSSTSIKESEREQKRFERERRNRMTIAIRRKKEIDDAIAYRTAPDAKAKGVALSETEINVMRRQSAAYEAYIKDGGKTLPKVNEQEILTQVFAEEMEKAKQEGLRRAAELERAKQEAGAVEKEEMKQADKPVPTKPSKETPAQGSTRTGPLFNTDEMNEVLKKRGSAMHSYDSSLNPKKMDGDFTCKQSGADSIICEYKKHDNATDQPNYIIYFKIGHGIAIRELKREKETRVINVLIYHASIFDECGAWRTLKKSEFLFDKHIIGAIFALDKAIGISRDLLELLATSLITDQVMIVLTPIEGIKKTQEISKEILEVKPAISMTDDEKIKEAISNYLAKGEPKTIKEIADAIKISEAEAERLLSISENEKMVKKIIENGITKYKEYFINTISGKTAELVNEANEDWIENIELAADEAWFEFIGIDLETNDPMIDAFMQERTGHPKPYSSEEIDKAVEGWFKNEPSPAGTSEFEPPSDSPDADMTISRFEDKFDNNFDLKDLIKFQIKKYYGLSTDKERSPSKSRYRM